MVGFPGEKDQNQHGRADGDDKERLIVPAVHESEEHGDCEQQFQDHCDAERPFTLAGKLFFQAGAGFVSLDFLKDLKGFF